MQPASFTHCKLGCEATIRIQCIQDPYVFAMIFMLFLFRVLKDLQDWKEAPLDCVVLSLYQLQAFYLNETKRGLVGLGKYTIAPKYKSACLDQYAVQYLPCSCPEDIVRRIREGECGIKMPTVEVKTDDKYQQPQDKPMTTLSAHARAQLVVKNDKISFDTKLRVFNVKGLSGITRVVNLFPRASCSCPSTNECYHILAAKMIMGMSESSKPVRRNLTQLRKNTRSRKDKKSGRKKPRPNDVMPESQGESTYPKHVLYKQTFIYLMLLYRWGCP